MRLRALACVAACGLLLIPAVQAGPAPALYFLKDGDTPLVGTGILNETAPDSLDPSTRLIVAGDPTLPSAMFELPTPDHPGRLFGPLLVGLWTGPSLVYEGNITAGIFRVDGNGDAELLAEQGVGLTLNETAIPDPTALVPPDPTDPEASVAHILAQVTAGLLQPPTLLQHGFVDIEVAETDRIGIGFWLQAPDGSTAPLPLGVAATIQYDGQLNPSFLYVPWYAPDPEPTTTTPPPRATTTSSTSTTTSTGPSGDDSEDSPAGMLVAGLALVGAAAVVVRRRL